MSARAALARTPALVWLGLATAIAIAIGAITDVVGLVTLLGLLNVGVLIILLLRRDIAWGFLFYLTALVFFQTGFWFRLPGFPDLYPARVASTLLYLVFIAQILLSARRAPRLGGVEKSMLAFIVVLMISVVTSGQSPHWQMLLSGYAYPFLFYYFARTVMTRDKQIGIVMAYLVLLGIYLGVMGIFEKLRWYDLVYPRFIVDPTRGTGLSRLGFRVRGIFLQPCVLGTVMTMAFFVGWLYLQQLRNLAARVVQVILLLVTPPTVFFTQTRSVYAGFLAALTVAAVASRRLRPVSITLVLAAMLGAFLNWSNLAKNDRSVGGIGEMNTVETRIELFYESMEIFIDSPFVGCGFMNFPVLAPSYRRPRDVPFYGHIDSGFRADLVGHNMVATIMAEQGALGLIPYLLMYILVFRISLRAYRTLPRRGLLSRDFVVCVWCAMACYFINAMFLEFRYFEYPNVLYFFLMGTMVGAYERHVARQRAAEAEEPAAEAVPLHLQAPAEVR